MARGFVTRRSFRGASVQRRKTIWIGIVATTNAVNGPNGTLLFGGLNAAGLALRPFTIVRVRGMMHMSSDQEVSDELQQIALGLAVVSDQALAAGVASVPTPFADLASDLWFSHNMLMTEFLLGTAVGFSGDFGVTGEFGSKAMRKVAVGEDLAIVAETSSLSSGTLFQKAGRMLVKLH